MEHYQRYYAMGEESNVIWFVSSVESRNMSGETYYPYNGYVLVDRKHSLYGLCSNMPCIKIHENGMDFLSEYGKRLVKDDEYDYFTLDELVPTMGGGITLEGEYTGKIYGKKHTKGMYRYGFDTQHVGNYNKYGEYKETLEKVVRETKKMAKFFMQFGNIGRIAIRTK